MLPCDPDDKSLNIIGDVFTPLMKTIHNDDFTSDALVLQKGQNKKAH